MNKEQFAGHWNEIKGKIKQQWGKLTDDDITRLNGKREELLGKLQQRYGYAKEKAEQELSSWEEKLTLTGVGASNQRSAQAGSNQRSGQDFSRQNPRSNKPAQEFPKKDKGTRK